LFKSTSVASVSGMSGTAAGLVTIAATYVIGDITTRYSFTPVLITGSVVPLVGALLVLWLIRNPQTAAERRVLRRI
jgi:ACS family hexuronate transporter-like MFS transporter